MQRVVQALALAAMGLVCANAWCVARCALVPAPVAVQHCHHQDAPQKTACPYAHSVLQVEARASGPDPSIAMAVVSLPLAALLPDAPLVCDLIISSSGPPPDFVLNIPLRV